MPESNGERYATQKDLREAEGRIIAHFDNKVESLVSRDTCAANHRFLDVGKLWGAVAVVGLLQVIVIAKMFGV